MDNEHTFSVEALEKLKQINPKLVLQRDRKKLSNDDFSLMQDRHSRTSEEDDKERIGTLLVLKKMRSAKRRSALKTQKISLSKRVVHV